MKNFSCSECATEPMDEKHMLRHLLFEHPKKVIEAFKIIEKKGPLTEEEKEAISVLSQFVNKIERNVQ